LINLFKFMAYFQKKLFYVGVPHSTNSHGFIFIFFLKIEIKCPYR
jgi:hypothetical protein